MPVIGEIMLKMRVSKTSLQIIGFCLLFGLAFVPLCTANRGKSLKTPAIATPAPQFNPYTETDSLLYEKMSQTLGPIPDVGKRIRATAILKFLGNQQWQWVADGMQTRANHLKLRVDILGAGSETDLAGQLATMETMLKKKNDAFLVSPETVQNLVPAIEKARKAGILIVNVDGAVLKDAEHWIGSNHYQHGEMAAHYFMQHHPRGGKVAVIKGLPDANESNLRAKGFADTLRHKGFQIVGTPTADWDLHKAYEAARLILRHTPDLKGFYCCNDIMALGVVEAVKKEGKLGKVIVIGTDGIQPAYDSIRRGELTGTVDKFPYLIGQIAVEVTQRLLGGQKVPRVVLTPQNLITLENIDHPLASYSGKVHPVTK